MAYNHAHIVKSSCTSGADLNLQSEEGKTALICAAYYGYTQIAKYLIALWADVHLTDNCGYNALDYAPYAFTNKSHRYANGERRQALDINAMGLLLPELGATVATVHGSETPQKLQTFVR